MNWFNVVRAAISCGLGAVMGYGLGAVRYPLGRSAIAKEADEQRKRAWAAEEKLGAIRRAGEWKS